SPVLITEEAVVPLQAGESTLTGKLSIGYETDDVPLLQLEIAGTTHGIIHVHAEDYFSALCSVRLHLEERGMFLLCAGASEDVFPSLMSIDMSEGRMAYHLRMGRKAARSD